MTTERASDAGRRNGRRLAAVLARAGLGVAAAYPRTSSGFRRSVSDGSSPKQSLYALENSPKCQKPQLSASVDTVVDP